MAGEYWLVKHTLGWSINEHPFLIVRIGLLTFNALPLILYLWMIGRLAERYGAADWGRLFVVAAAAFGTLLLDVPHHVQQSCPRRLRHAGRPVCGAAGRFSEGGSEGLRRGCQAARDGSCVAGAGRRVPFQLRDAGRRLHRRAGLLLLDPRRLDGRCSGSLPPLLLLVAAYFLLNHLATGQWLPVYEKIDTAWYQYPGSVWTTIHPGVGTRHRIRQIHRSSMDVRLSSSLRPSRLVLADAGLPSRSGGHDRGRRRQVRDGTAAARPRLGRDRLGTLAVSLVVFVFYAFW